MKRYLLFTFDDYYPGGGAHDLHGAYDTAEEATTQGEREITVGNRDEFHVLDIQTGQIIAEKRRESKPCDVTVNFEISISADETSIPLKP